MASNVKGETSVNHPQKPKVVAKLVVKHSEAAARSTVCLQCVTTEAVPWML
jgi:hypothetical protein